MNLPSDTPKLPKWIFLLGDAALVTTAWFIHDGADHPDSGTALVLTVACIVVAVLISVIPFMADYVRLNDEAVDNRQRSLQALAVTVASASEQVSIAATGLQGIAEAAQDNFSRTERLALQINEKIAELDARLADAKKDDGDTAAMLEAVAKKTAKAAVELEAAISKAAEAAARPAPPPPPVHIPEVPPVFASRIVEIRPAVSATPHPFYIPPPSKGAAPRKEPAPTQPPPEEPAMPPPPAAAPADKPAPEVPAMPEGVAAAPAPVPRKRSPRKPAPAAVLAPAPAEEPATELALDAPAADKADPSAAPPEIAEPAISADGATRLVITAYIGIGNRLFIRGDGPGLSWEKGVPLTFVSIGKWRWETKDASGTVKFKLYKNDQTECVSLGERSVEPGAQQEFTAAF